MNVRLDVTRMSRRMDGRTYASKEQDAPEQREGGKDQMIMGINASLKALSSKNSNGRIVSVSDVSYIQIILSHRACPTSVPHFSSNPL